jgi:hypothetical protein
MPIFGMFRDALATMTSGEMSNWMASVEIAETGLDGGEAILPLQNDLTRPALPGFENAPYVGQEGCAALGGGVVHVVMRDIFAAHAMPGRRAQQPLDDASGGSSSRNEVRRSAPYVQTASGWVPTAPPPPVSAI